MKKTYVTDMTVGKPLGLLVSFMLPLLIGNIFQQLYNIVDSIIVRMRLLPLVQRDP